MTARFTIPDDPVALRMENDLLALERDHLRGLLGNHRAGISADLDRLRDEVEIANQQLAAANHELAAERDRVEGLIQARSDLRWLLQRLENSIARVVLRRFSGYRSLISRWLDA